MIGGLGATERFVNDDFSVFERYWSDSLYRANYDAMRQDHYAQMHAAIDAGMAGLNARQRARWEREGEAE